MRARTDRCAALRLRGPKWLAGALAALAFAAGCDRSPTGPSGDVAAVLVGAGDIGWCGSPGPAATAQLLDQIAGTVFTAGDNAYPFGTEAEFADCYHPTWGRHKARTRPSPGNHDYGTPGAAPYFAYFGDAAGPPGRGYYGFALGSWQVLSLNSNVSMAAGSAQDEWVRGQIAANPAACTLAYWHHPLFSSGPHGDDPHSADLWRTLYDAGVDVVVNGHDHLYERFAPQTPAGAPDPRGIRQFTVGTGGALLYDVLARRANSERLDNTAYGVLKLTLRSRAYDWEFITGGGGIGDSGSGTCFEQRR